MNISLLNSSLTENGKMYRGKCGSSLFGDDPLGLIVAYCIVIVVSLTGNLLITLIIYKTPTMRTATNLLIVNMSISDVIFSVFHVPIYVYNHFSPGPYMALNGFLAHLFCKLSSKYLNQVAICVSILTMIAIAYDRFYAVVYPFKAKFRTRWSRIVTIVSIWTFSVVLYIVEAIRFETVNWKGRTYCVYTAKLYSRTFTKAFQIVEFILLFAFPLLAMCVLYGVLIVRMHLRKVPGVQISERQSRENTRNRRVVYMSLTVVILFAFVISPYRIVDLIESSWVRRRAIQCWQMDRRLLVNFLMQSSCALNPFVYFAFSENYRQGLVKLLHCSKTNRVGVANPVVQR